MEGRWDRFGSQVEQKEFLLRSNTKIAPLEGNQYYQHAHGEFE